MSEDATKDPVETLRRHCMALPEATERESHGGPSWFVRTKPMFVTLSDHLHGDDRLAFWCAAPVGEAAAMVADDPRRYFIPPYVGHRGWVGVYIDTPDVDWDEVAAVVEDAYRCVAPKRLLAQLDARGA